MNKNIQEVITAVEKIKNHSFSIMRSPMDSLAIFSLLIYKELDEKIFNNKYFINNSDFRDIFIELQSTSDLIHFREVLFFSKNIFKNLSESQLAFIIDTMKHIKIRHLKMEDKFVLIKQLLKSDDSRFFNYIKTPFELCELLIDISNPKLDDKIIDPSAKSGEFLLAAFEKKYKVLKKNKKIDEEYIKNFLAENIFGNEENTDLNHLIRTFEVFLLGESAKLNNEYMQEEKRFSEYDCIATNPPFNSRLNNKSDYESLELAYIWKKDNDENWFNTGKLRKTVTYESLVLEKSRKYLKEGGRIAIILPEGILFNTNFEYVRYWIKNNYKIERIISLPLGVFRPFAAVKTSVFILKKPSQNEKIIDYSITFSEFENETNFDIENLEKNSFDVPISLIKTENFSYNYYAKAVSEISDLEHTDKLREVAEIVKNKSDKLFNENLEINYIDLSSVNKLTGQVTEPKKILSQEAPRRAYYEVKKGDVITAVSGHLGEKSHVSAYITEELDGSICSNGFKVLRPKGNINPIYLWYYLRSELFLSQVRKFMTGTVQFLLKEKDLIEFDIYLPPPEKQEEIAKQVLENIEKINEAQVFLQNPELYIEKTLRKEEHLL